MNTRLNLIGQTFGRLTAIADAPRTKHQTTQFVCLCECGNVHTVSGNNLKRGMVKSCGCFNNEKRAENSIKRLTTHGARGTNGDLKHKILYTCWVNMRERCFNPHRDQFEHYGGRGIQVCAQWSLSFEAFWRDMQATWSPGLCIDRKDNAGHYNKDNCRWATQSDQLRNQRKRSAITSMLLITLALCSIAHSKDLWVYERDPQKHSAVHHGLANGVPVLIDIYGEDSIESARMYGRGLVLNHYPFAESARLIRVKAQELYKGQASLVRWFEQDAAEGYDAEVRKER
jgi:hypothetical protein